MQDEAERILSATKSTTGAATGQEGKVIIRNGEEAEEEGQTRQETGALGVTTDLRRV